MATLAQLEKALVNADKAGDMDAARKLASVIKVERARLGGDMMLPEADTFGEVPGTTPTAKPTSLGEKVAGANEAALSAASSIPAGVVGSIAGVAKGVYDKLSGQPTVKGRDAAADLADKVTDALTYHPETQTGQQLTAKLGELTEPLQALGPVAGELAPLGEAAAAVRPVARAAAAEKLAAVPQVIKRAADPIQRAAAALTEQVTQKLAPDTTPTPGTGASAGAAAVDAATVRRQAAEELGFTGDTALTQGQATRDFQQQRFERETAKQGEIGEPIRQRMQNQNLHLQQKMDEFIDGTGAELTEPRGVGEIVDKALSGRRARDKTRTRMLYTEARKSDEARLAAPADTKVTIKGMDDEDIQQSPIDYLNSRPTKVETSKAVDDARSNGLHLKVLIKNDDGTYAANPAATVGQMEDWRREISQSLSKTASDTEIRDVSIMKKLIDGVTEPLAGPLYKKARQARATMAADYQNSSLVKQLLGTKPGSTDRSVSLEQVFGKVINPSTSVDQISHMERLLKTEGETGQQAWKELQGGMLRHIRDETLKGVTRDSAGNQIINTSALDRTVTALDKNGKLEAILGKQQADKVRLVNDVAKDVFTAPPGAVNTSNTATVLAGLLDVAISGTTGVPVPVTLAVKQITSRIKDAKLRARVKQSLGGQQ